MYVHFIKNSVVPNYGVQSIQYNTRIVSKVTHMYIVRAVKQSDSISSESIQNQDKAYGVWMGQRRTAIVVDADSRNEAIAKARKKKKRGGNNVEAARLLNEKERKTVRTGAGLRTGKNHEKPGYAGKRGKGTPLGGWK